MNDMALKTQPILGKSLESAATHTEAASVPRQPTGPVRDKALDKAAEFLGTVEKEDLHFTPEKEKAVLRRIDYRVLPLLL